MTRKAAEFWWNLNRKKKISIPSEVAYYSHENAISENIDWQTTTWKDVHNKRNIKQKSNIRNKRMVKTEIKPCYIWVFYNDSWIFHGWYVYIKTLHKDFALNFRNRNESFMIEKVMNLFPCGILPMEENFDAWAATFAKLFHKEAFGRKVQGLATCHCKIKYNNEIIDIIK